MISHASQNVPYYHRVFKERYLQPSGIKEIDDITKIAILTKQDVRKYKLELVATNLRRYEPVKLAAQLENPFSCITTRIP